MQLHNPTLPEMPLAESHLATGIIFTQNDQVLLLYRSSTGYADGLWALPGGKCDQGESIFINATREAREETSVLIKPNNLRLMHVIHRIDQGPKNWVLFFFLAERWQGELINNEPHKHQELRWFPLHQLPANMLPTHKQAIEGWQNNTRCSIFPA